MEAATHLDENRDTHMEVAWVPGHMGIAGNNRVDEIAKEAIKLEPATETTTLANLFRQIWVSMMLEWVWASKPMTRQYAIADCIPPSLTGSHAFHMLN